MTTFKAMVDCDVLVYESAFGAQKTRYDVTIPGSTSVLTFMDAKERDEYLKAEGLTKKDVTIEPWLDVLPEAAAISIAQRNMEFILNELRVTEYEAFLTGEGNYREKIAVTKPYKGNRTADKPIHYAAVKEFYIETVGAQVIQGKEADDLLGIRATSDIGNIICTIDKDLNQVPGLHFDWNLMKKYKVTKKDADRFFMTQLITGDNTDNIPGLPKAGEKAALALVEEAAGDNEKLFELVLASYFKKGYNVKYIEEQGQLLWIQREDKEPLWTIERFKKHLKSSTK